MCVKYENVNIIKDWLLNLILPKVYNIWSQIRVYTSILSLKCKYESLACQTKGYGTQATVKACGSLVLCLGNSCIVFGITSNCYIVYFIAFNSY